MLQLNCGKSDVILFNLGNNNLAWKDRLKKPPMEARKGRKEKSSVETTDSLWKSGKSGNTSINTVLKSSLDLISICKKAIEFNKII